MQRFIDFFKTTAIGGLLLILPLAAIGFVFTYVLGILLKLNRALAEHLPYELADHPLIILLTSLLGIVLLCFIAGLIVKTGLGERLANALDEFLYKKLPMYGMVRKLADRFTGNDILEFTPAEIDVFGNSTRSLGFVIEQLPDDRYAVFVPSSPALTIGQIYIVPANNVHLIAKPARLAIDAITQWGAGTARLYEPDQQDK